MRDKSRVDILQFAVIVVSAALGLEIALSGNWPFLTGPYQSAAILLATLIAVGLVSAGRNFAAGVTLLCGVGIMVSLCVGDSVLVRVVAGAIHPLGVPGFPVEINGEPFLVRAFGTVLIVWGVVVAFFRSNCRK